MSEITDLLDQWQAALRKRDRLQAIKEGMVSLELVDHMKADTIADIDRLLAVAEGEVELLQQRLIGIKVNGVSGS